MTADLTLRKVMTFTHTYHDHGVPGAFRYTLVVAPTGTLHGRYVTWECVEVLSEEGRPSFDQTPLLGCTGACIHDYWHALPDA
jgi:hypothetical protein